MSDLDMLQGFNADQVFDEFLNQKIGEVQRDSLFPEMTAAFQFKGFEKKANHKDTPSGGEILFMVICKFQVLQVVDAPDMPAAEKQVGKEYEEAFMLGKAKPNAQGVMAMEHYEGLSGRMLEILAGFVDMTADDLQQGDNADANLLPMLEQVTGANIVARIRHEDDKKPPHTTRSTFVYGKDSIFCTPEKYAEANAS